MRAVLLAILFAGLVALAVALSGAFQGDAPEGAEPEATFEAGLLAPVFGEVAEAASTLQLSGRAEPETILVMLGNSQRIRQVPVSAEGQWEAEIAVEPAQALSLTTETFAGDTRISGDETLLRVPAPGAEDGISQQPLILLTVPGGPSRVIQTPFGSALSDGALSVAIVEYDDLGGVILSGTAAEPGTVSLFFRGQFLGETAVEPDGRWRFIAIAPASRDASRQFTVEHTSQGGQLSRVEVGFVPLEPDHELRQAATQWHVRRPLLGGGSQVSAVFANPPTSAAPSEPAVPADAEE